MTEKHTIVLGEDEDSFLGYDPSASEIIDIPASKIKYMEMVTKKIQGVYPELIIEFNWGGSSNWAWLEQEEGYELLGYDLEDLESEVYNNGEFWVEK